MEFSLAYFVFMVAFVLAFWWLWAVWAQLNDRQTIFVAAIIFLCVLGAELQKRETLRECGEQVVEMLKDEQDVQTR